MSFVISRRTFVISRRTFNVRISISMFGIEIGISVQ